MVVRMRHTRSHTANRRSHHALEASRTSICKDCGSVTLRHRACVNCGKYKGVLIVDVAGASARKEKREKAKMKERGIEAKAEAK